MRLKTIRPFTALAIGPALCGMAFNGFSEHAPIDVLIFGIEMGVLPWAGALIVLRHPLGAELTKLLTRIDRALTP